MMYDNHCASPVLPIADDIESAPPSNRKVLQIVRSCSSFHLKPNMPGMNNTANPISAALCDLMPCQDSVTHNSAITPNTTRMRHSAWLVFGCSAYCFCTAS